MPFTWKDTDAESYEDHGAGVVAQLWRPAPRLLITRVKGHATLECLRHYTARAEREMSLGRLTVFHEWADLTGYDPAVRDELKRWGKLHNGDFERVVYLVRSKVIAMLISVAALTLGRELHATTDEVAFLADLFRTLEERGA